MPRWFAESRPCPICRSNSYKTLGLRGGSAHRRSKGVECSIVRCRKCDVHYQRPTLVPETNPYTEVSDAYFTDARSSEPTIEKGRKFGELAAERCGRVGRLLEVGCGGGWFIEGAARGGWEVSGIDFTDEFASRGRARGLAIETAAPETSEFLARREHYDAIIMMNILEHLYHPMDTLVRALEALRPGGVVAIGVPNEAGFASSVFNLAARLHPARWSVSMSPTFAPFHVVGFTPASLQYALHSTGFELIELSTRAAPAFLERDTLWKRVGSVALDGVLRFANQLGRGDALSCWARRPAE